MRNLNPLEAAAARWCLPKEGFDGKFHVLPKFHTVRVEEFDAVFWSGVVRGGDDHTGIGAKPARQKPDARRGKDAQIDHFGAACQQAFSQGGL